MKKLIFASVCAITATMAFAETLTYNCHNDYEASSMTLKVSYPEHRPLSMTFMGQNTTMTGEGDALSFTMDDYNISLSMPVLGGTFLAEFPMTEIYRGTLRGKDRFCDNLARHDDFGMPIIMPPFCSTRQTIAYARIKLNDEDPDGPIMGMPGYECTMVLE